MNGNPISLERGHYEIKKSLLLSSTNLCLYYIVNLKLRKNCLPPSYFDHNKALEWYYIFYKAYIYVLKNIYINIYK